MWTDKEIEFLRANAPLMTMRELTDALEPLSYSAGSNLKRYDSIRKRLQILGVSPKSNGWMEPEIELLKDNGSIMTAKDLQALLLPLTTSLGKAPRTVENIRHKLKSLSITPQPDSYKYWSEDDVGFLVANHDKMSFGAIAKKLGFTESSVKTKYYTLGLKYGYMVQVTPWMETMLEKIKATGKSLYETSMELFDTGHVVEVRQQGRGAAGAGRMAVFCRDVGPPTAGKGKERTDGV